MSNRSYRIKTDLYSKDQQIKVKLDQHYDQLNILSLTLKPADNWANRCSNFGVVVGRVTANKGFGIPNAKVSIFIPLTAEDEYNPEIVARYPYKSTTDKRNGIRYNLLPSVKQSAAHTPVGNFPTKEEILRDDLWLEIYQKYYRFTTRTNNAGDFMFYGVPVGTYIIHYDIDLSDIEEASVLPFEMMAQGVSPSKFDGPYKFKASPDIDSLPQIVSTDKTINVQPFWGSSDLCDVQITRSDFDLSEKGIELKSYALFIGSAVTDSENNLVNQRCKVKKHVGEQAQLQTMPGKIEILSVVDSNGDNVPDKVEFLNVPAAKIDDSGVWAFLIELNGQKVIKDEYGNEIVSPDASRGIVKNGFFRFKFAIGPESDDNVKYRAKYIVPNNGVHQYAYLFNRKDVEYTDDSGNVVGTIPGFNSLGDVDNTGVDSLGYYHCGPLFREFQRKKIYTVRNYIPRYLKNTGFPLNVNETYQCLGFKNVDREKAKAPIPYNRMDSNTGVWYNLICILYSALFFVLSGLNWMVHALNAVISVLNTILYGITWVICQLISFLNSVLHAITSALNAVGCPGTLFTILGVQIGWCFFTVGPWSISTPSWCPASPNIIPYITYISFECCSNCDGTNCNCYIPLLDCYNQTNICNTPSVGGSKPLKRCTGGALNTCETICNRQKNGIPADNPTKRACQLQGNSCNNLDTISIGMAGYTQNVYSFCLDSLKQCMLGEYVCNREELVFEFWNAWITGLLYFVQIRYKEKITSDGYLKKAKFCDADWDAANYGGHPYTFPFKNESYDMKVTERELFQIPNYTQLDIGAGLIKYWPRQPIPPLGWAGSGNDKTDYIKGPFDDIYYNARQMKRSYGYDSTPSFIDLNMGHILLATEIMNLGSYLVVDDPDNAPFFITQVPATTYKRPEDLSNFFCFSCTEIVPNDQEHGIRLHEKICEFGTDFNGENETLNPSTALYDLHYGLYVDESFHSGRTYILTSNTVENLLNVKQNLRYGIDVINYIEPPHISYTFIGYDLTDSSIQPEADAIYVNQVKNVWERQFVNNGDIFIKNSANPFYMYFGLHPGKTAIDIVHNNFIPKNICNS